MRWRLPLQAEYGPTLPGLLRRCPRVVQIALIACICLLLALPAALLAQRTVAGLPTYRQTGPSSFQFRYPTILRPVKPLGDEFVRLEQRKPSGLFVQSFSVAPLELSGPRAASAGELAALARTRARVLAKRYTALAVVQEGRFRLNNTYTYTTVFRARLGKRVLIGREVLVPLAGGDSRTGLRLLLLATPAADIAVSQPGTIGYTGALRGPLSTFKF